MRRLLVLITLGLATIVALIVASGFAFSRIDTFERRSDDRHLAVRAVHDEGEVVLGWLTREDVNDVTVFVLLYRRPGIHLLVAYRVDIDVTLSQPLGTRQVRDGTGYVVPEAQ